MSIKHDVYDAIKDNPDAKALLGDRIYDTRAPQKKGATERPYLIFATDDDVEPAHFGGVGSWSQVEFALRVFANDTKTARRVDEAVRTAIRTLNSAVDETGQPKYAAVILQSSAIRDVVPRGGDSKSAVLLDQSWSGMRQVALTAAP